MKGKDIIKLITTNHLEEYNITVSQWPDNWAENGIIKLDITGIGDIGHSDKISTFETKEAED